MKKKMVSLAMLRDPEPDTPGPGQYEDHRSSFKTPQTTGSPRGPVIQPLTVMSPISPGRAAAAISNPSLQKMSVPSIPSRFLTPIIDANQEELDGSGDICKMSRLVDDPSKVGPGTYQIQEDQIVKSPKGAISWQNTLSQRGGIKPSNQTQDTVGPGSYNGNVKFYRPEQPFFSRQGMGSGVRNKRLHHGSTSIRTNYEGDGDSDDEDQLLSKKKNPGPGHYLT